MAILLLEVLKKKLGLHSSAKLHILDGYSYGCIDKKLSSIDKIYECKFVSANILKVSAGTNAIMSGDWGHGGRHYIKLENEEGSTAWLLRIKTRGGDIIEVEDPQSLELLFEGASEMETLYSALKFVLKVFEKEIPNLECVPQELTTLSIIFKPEGKGEKQRIKLGVGG